MWNSAFFLFRQSLQMPPGTGNYEQAHVDVFPSEILEAYSAVSEAASNCQTLQTVDKLIAAIDELERSVSYSVQVFDSCVQHLGPNTSAQSYVRSVTTGLTALHPAAIDLQAYRRVIAVPAQDLLFSGQRIDVNRRILASTSDAHNGNSENANSAARADKLFAVQRHMLYYRELTALIEKEMQRPDLNRAQRASLTHWMSVSKERLATLAMTNAPELSTRYSTLIELDRLIAPIRGLATALDDTLRHLPSFSKLSVVTSELKGKCLPETATNLRRTYSSTLEATRRAKGLSWQVCNACMLATQEIESAFPFFKIAHGEKQGEYVVYVSTGVATVLCRAVLLSDHTFYPVSSNDLKYVVSRGALALAMDESGIQTGKNGRPIIKMHPRLCRLAPTGELIPQNIIQVTLQHDWRPVLS